MIAKRAPRTRCGAPSAFRLGPASPGRAVAPETIEETASIVRDAAAAATSIVAFGGGTLQASANAPDRYDVALSTTKLCGVHAYDPRDLTIGIGAGTTLAALRDTLAAEGHFLPLDAPYPDRATVGGTLAAGWTGPRRAHYGRPRDLLIGSTIVLADGTVARAGGMVVKNVTGYDMSRLYVGSHGTLGILARANFKVLPAPAARRIALSPYEGAQRDRAFAHARGLELEPAALLALDARSAPRALADPQGRDLLVALFEGSEALVDAAVRRYRSALGAAGVAETRIADGRDAEGTFQRVLDAYLAAETSGTLTLLARGLPTTAAERGARARATRTEGATASVLTDLLNGDVVVRLAARRGAPPDALADAVTTLRDVLGPMQRLAGATEGIDAWGTPPPAIETLRALKRRFDPDGVLAPGRLVGGV